MTHGKITYEKLLELKKAGFPQPPKAIRGHYVVKKETDPIETALYEPSLEEVIDELGEKILGLNRTHDEQGRPTGWIADTHTHKCECGKPQCGGYNWEAGEAPTAKEAAINLYIALNGK